MNEEEEARRLRLELLPQSVAWKGTAGGGGKMATETADPYKFLVANEDPPAVG